MEEVKDTAPVAQETQAEAPQEPQNGQAAPEVADVTLSAAEFEEVRKHIETLQKEKDETVALAQRIQADFDNYRKRNAALHLESVNEGERGVIKALLPVLDNFDRAVDNSAGVDEGFVNGVKLVQRQLLEALGKFGLAEIDAAGKFDPTQHEAAMQQEAEGRESGEIVQVLQKGYKVRDRIVRHSMVSVAK